MALRIRVQRAGTSKTHEEKAGTWRALGQGLLRHYTRGVMDKDDAFAQLNAMKARQRAADERAVARGDITREELGRRNAVITRFDMTGVLEQFLRTDQY